MAGSNIVTVWRSGPFETSAQVVTVVETNRFSGVRLVISKSQLSEVSKINPTNSSEKPRCRGLVVMAKQLSKRKVCRTAISYILVMWLILQIADVIFPMIGLPDWSLSLIVFFGVMGFPFVLILAWVFQITPEGIVLDSASDEAKVDRQLDLSVNVLLLLSSVVLSILLLLQFDFDHQVGTAETGAKGGNQSYVVSSISFTAASDQPDSVALASRVEEELRQRLVLLEDIEILMEFSSLDDSDDRQRLALSGSILLDGDTVRALVHLIDLSAARYLTSMTFNVEVDSMLVAEIVTAQRIVDELRNTLMPVRGI